MMASADPSMYIERVVSSDSRPDVEYSVRLWLENWRAFKKGTISCSCKSWIFQRKPITEKACKHTKRVAWQLEDAGEAEVEGSFASFKRPLEENVRGRIEGLIAGMEWTDQSKGSGGD